MKKNILLLLFLNCSFFTAFAQDQHLIDSLESTLKNMHATKLELGRMSPNLNDTAETLILVKLAQAYDGNDPDLAMDYVQQSLSLSEQIGYKKGIGNAYNMMAIINATQGDYLTSLKLYKKALKIREQIGDKRGTAGSYINIGSIYSNLGNYPEALKNYFIGLKITEQIGEQDFMANALNNIGFVYMKQENYPEALKIFFANKKIQEKKGDKYGLGYTYRNISGIYLAQGNKSEAMKYALLTLKMNEDINDKSGLARAYSCIAGVYDELGNYEEAIKNKQLALKIYEEVKSKAGICGTCIDLGYIYSNFHKYKEATASFNKGIAIGKEIGQLEFVKIGYAGLAELDSAQGNFKEALMHYKLFVKLQDSLFNNENTEKTMALQLNYDFNKKQAADSIKVSEEKKVITAELKSEQTKSYALYGGLALMLIVSGIFFQQRNKISKEKKRSEDLLLNILPTEVADELKSTGVSKAKTFSMVTVMFTDFKDFTKISEQVSGELLVDEIHYCFSAFDNIIQKHKVEKIKTIGDAYMCAGGLPVLNYTHAKDVVKAALEMRDFMLNRKKEKEAKGEIPFELRIGIHTGPVVSGIVGIKKFQYDIWGDTVNLAARMESSSDAGKVNISRNTHELVKNDFNCEYRGKIAAKNKGEVDMYFVEAKM
jgi:adenylate cyclase